MGAKKRKWPRKKLLVCVFLVATYGNEVILVGGHKKHTVIYGAVHAFQSTIQNLSLKKGCAEDQKTATVMAAVAAAVEHYDCIWPVYYLTERPDHLTVCGLARWMAKTYPMKKSRLRWPSEQA